MKRVGYLWDKIFSIENLNKAVDKATKGKRKNKNVKYVLSERDKVISWIIDNVGNNPNYVIKSDRVFTKKDPSTGKIRTIRPLKFFPDQIIEWAILLVIYPHLYRDIDIGVACNIKGRGTHYAAKRIKNKLKREERRIYGCNKYSNPVKHKCCWVYKDDIKKFFDNIPTYLIEKALRKRFKDEKLIAFIMNQYYVVPKGVFIGRLLSQHLSSFALTEFDSMLRHNKLVGEYSRFMDDIVVLTSSKENANKIRIMATDWMRQNGLELAKPQIFKVAEVHQLTREVIFRDKFTPVKKVKLVFKKNTNETEILNVMQEIRISEYAKHLGRSNRTIIFYIDDKGIHVGDVLNIKDIHKYIQKITESSVNLNLLDFCGFKFNAKVTRFRKRFITKTLRLLKNLRAGNITQHNASHFASIWGIIKRCTVRKTLWDLCLRCIDFARVNKTIKSQDGYSIPYINNNEVRRVKRHLFRRTSVGHFS